MLSPAVDDPETLRSYAVIFEKMVPSNATCAAAKALRFWAEEIERRRSGRADDQTTARIRRSAL